VTRGAARNAAARLPRLRTGIVPFTGLIVVCVMLAACGRTATTSPTLPSSASKGAALVTLSGGTVTVIVPTVATSLNPHTSAGDTTSTRMVTALTDPQVFEVSPDLIPTLNTNFVSSAEVVNVNPQTVVYALDPDAKWSDGVAIGVKDFIYNWAEQAGSQGSAPPIKGTFDAASTLGYRDISAITAIGHSVKVVFDHPYSDWDDLFDDLIPEHAATKIGWDAGYRQPGSLAYVSGGPFKIQSWVPGSRIVLVRNPRWWGPAANVSKIVVEVGVGPKHVSGLLARGSAQVVYSTEFTSALLENVSSSPKFNSQVDLGTTMLQLAFNLQRPLDQSADFRQGVAYEIDRRSIVGQLIEPLDPSLQVDDDFLAVNSQHSYTADGVQFQTDDPPAAATLLATAGMTLDAAGSWTVAGTPVVLDLRWASGDPWSQLVAPAIEAELVQAGFEVRANPVAGREMIPSDLSDNNWDLALVPVVASPYPSQMAEAYSLSQSVAGQGDSSDWSGFDAPQVDALFEAAANQLDPAKAALVYQQIDDLLWEAMPSVPLFAEPSLLVSDATVTGVQSDSWGAGPLWNATNWATIGVAQKRG